MVGPEGMADGGAFPVACVDEGKGSRCIPEEQESHAVCHVSGQAQVL